MTKEKLMEWGLTEEQAGKVMEGLNGSFVTKARFNEVNTELSAAKKTIGERDAQLEELKKSTGDVEALNQRIVQLQADNKKKDEDYTAQLKSLKIGNAVELALTGARAKNTIAAKALLADFVAKAELSEDGKVVGLDDAVQKLVEGKDTAFLFDKAGGTKLRGAVSAERGEAGGDGITREQFRQLSPAQRYDFSVSHPDEYKQMYGGI